MSLLSTYSSASIRGWTSATTISTWTQQAQLSSNTPTINAGYGRSVAMDNSGNYAVVGAYIEGTGSVYIYIRSGTTWTLQQKITPSGTSQFGFQVSMNADGDYIAVTAIAEGTSSPPGTGRVYIYTRSGTTWTQQQKLFASDGLGSLSFGTSISLNYAGDAILIGAPDDINAGGSAYYFYRIGTTWTQQSKLVASDPENLARFGASVSLSGDNNYAIISAPNRTTNPGAYVFNQSGSVWTQQQKITPTLTITELGTTVSINQDGSIFAAGNIGDDTYGTNAGACYIYRRTSTTWSQQQILYASDAQANDNFGYVNLNNLGDTLIVGAPGEDTIASNAGAAYVFQLLGTTYVQQTIFRPSTLTASAGFGSGVALSKVGTKAIVGAPGGTPNFGSAYIFTE